MATTPSAPTGAAAIDASEEMSDCIIASSNRHYDLLPFCNSLYYAEPQKWGCILPWDFPQCAAKEVEEEFLRKYFTATEIHMQGGAHGAGAGFRFLKQVWYSIALYNYEHRIPAIATWWLESEENSSILEDPIMRDALCNEEVNPETCFNSRDIQTYGIPLLACAVKQIQDRVKAKQALSVEETQMTDKPRSASHGDMAVDPVKTESVSMAPPPVEHNNSGIGGFSHEKTPRATSATVPTNEVAIPFPIYEETSRSKQQVRHSDYGHTVWSAGYPNHQIQGRKRGNRLSSASGGTRGGGYDRSAQEYQHRFNASMFPSNGALAEGPASFGAPIPGPAFHPGQVTGMHPNMGSPIPGVPQTPSYDNFATRPPTQHARGPNFPSGEHHALSSATPGTFAGSPANRGHITHRSDMERMPSEMSANSGFNNISAMSGDVRRSSFSSRGGIGLRGSNQLRGGKRGGGRGRDFSHQTPSVFEEGPYARKVSHEPYQKSNSNYSKRRGSAYQENTWRSGSEHPQVENTLPQRVLSGPHEYPVYQGFPSVAGSHLLPPFTFPPNQAGDRQNQAENRQAPAGLDRHQQVVPDYDVDERFIGSHATHVNELIVFNVPVHLSETEVARDFSQTCDVKVIGVHFDGKVARGPGASTKLAFVKLPDHIVARRVLDLREVYLYDQPLTVVVPRKWHGQHSMPFMPPQPGHELNASGSSFVPGSQFPLGSYGHPHDSAPPPTFGIAAMVTSSHTNPSGMRHSGPLNLAPATPYNAVKGEPGLSTVLSSNATPANSEPNTPRKKKNKKKKAATPHATIVEHDSGAPMSSINTMTPIVTPSKTKHKESLQERAASNDLTEAEGATLSNIVPATKGPRVADGGERAKDSQGPSQEPSDSSVQTSQLALEATRSGDSPQIDEQKSDTTSKVSPRSQVPKDSSNPSDVSLDSKQSQVLAIEKEPDVHHHSSPVSDRDRPTIVDRVSDSDHVDESFHTASGSPPTDKQPQVKAVPTNGPNSPNTVRTRKSAKLSDKRSTSSQTKKVDNDTDEHVHAATVEKTTRHDSTSAPEVSPPKRKSVQPQRTPTTALPISIEAPTPPKEKSSNALSDSKPPRSASNRSVSEPLSAQQTPIPTEASKSCDGPAARAKDLSLEKSVSLAKAQNRAEEDRPQTLGVQDPAHATSIPPTPMTAYHTAPTTPASLETPASKHSTEKSSGQAKILSKKGPSQTESFSMFGKKQQKQKKTSKGKGTLKGKPLELVNASNLASGSTSQGMSGTATPSPASASKSNKKPALAIKTETDSNAPFLNTTNPRLGSTSGETVCSAEAVTATSGQESPSKGGIRNYLGDLFNKIKSPIVSGTKTSLEDVPTEDELMESKAPATTQQTMFNIDHLVGQRTFEDKRSHGDKSVFTTDINTAFNDANDPDTSGMSVTGLGILASSSADLRETPKKKSKKKKKRNKSQREGSPGANEYDDKPESITTPSTRTDATSASFDAESDNNSDKSSTTMGQHTPPMSPPVTMSPSQRKLFEQRMTGEHILSPPAPRNKHLKKKPPHSRATSSATASSAQETPATSTTAPSEIERGQQKRVMKLFRIGSDDSSGDSNDDTTSPAPYIFSNIVDDDGNTQQVLLTLKHIIQLSNNGDRLNIYGLSNGSDDDVVLAVDGRDTAEEDESKDRGD